MYRPIFIVVVLPIFFQPLAGQQSAWELLLDENPSAAADQSIGWQDRLILHSLSPYQAQRYFSGQVTAEELILPDGRSLALFLQEKLNAEAHVYIPLASPCPLFEVQALRSSGHRLRSQGDDLTWQGGSDSGCAIAQEATTLLVQVQLESQVEHPVNLKLWSPEDPEPASLIPDQATNFPMSYETTLVVSVCGGEICPRGEFVLKVSEAAFVRGQVVGYFRPVLSTDQLGGGISFLTEGSDNNFFGTGAGSNITSGSGNSFFGGNAGLSNTSGNSNAFFGDQTGKDNTIGSNNSFFGALAGDQNTNGSANSFFGHVAGTANTTGSSNSFFGEAAGFSNTSGGSNSFFGKNAGLVNTIGANNSFFGQGAGFSNNTGFSNSFFGTDAGSENSSGGSNAAFGEAAGFNNTTGSANSFFGALSGLSNTTESNNTFVGALSNGANSITNGTALGNQAQVSQSDSLVLGSINGLNGATADVRVGIGTDMPAAPLHVGRSDGTVQIIRAQSTGPEAVRNMMDLINNGIPQFRLVDTSPDGDAWQFSNTNNNLNISLQGSGSQEFLIENDGDVRINNGTVLVTSSRKTKEDFRMVNPAEILNQVAHLKISEWKYKKDPEGIRHIGPVSEDFYRIFGVGDGDKHVTPTDLSGVALAAIQGLLEQNQKLNQQLSELRREIQGLKTRKARGNE